MSTYCVPGNFLGGEDTQWRGYAMGVGWGTWQELGPKGINSYVQTQVFIVFNLEPVPPLLPPPSFLKEFRV